MPLFDENDFRVLSQAEKETLKGQLVALANALRPIGALDYRNELCWCDPDWSSHGSLCVWNLPEDLIPAVEKRIGMLEEEL